MISSGHRKHAALARPSLGRFGRHEWAIVGTYCSRIQALARQVIAALSDRYHCAYLDAEHAAADAATPLPGMLADGATLEYTDLQHSHQLRTNATLGSFQFHRIFNEADLMLVNGNHHQAAAQLVVIDPARESSLRKRLEQLTDVRLILLAEGVEQVFDFVENMLPTGHTIPRLALSDTAGIIRFFEREMQMRTPLLNGLVLAGGQSQRMGRDKGEIAWHGRPQREHQADLLQGLCADVFISCRPGQSLESAYPTLPDTFTDLGPYGAILSAFRRQPDRAWLVVACDLPLLDRETLEFLVQNRAVKRVATAFQNPDMQMPEPLITIWEPKSYSILLSFLAQGYSCPRKVLINNDVHILSVPDPAALTNVNTPEEAATIRLTKS